MMQMLNRFKGNDHVGTVVGHAGKFLSVALRIGEVFGDEMLVCILRRGTVDIETPNTSGAGIGKHFAPISAPTSDVDDVSTLDKVSCVPISLKVLEFNIRIEICADCK